MTRKKKSEMAPPPSPMPNVKRALLLGLIATAVLHFGNCESLTVVHNSEGKDEMSDRVRRISIRNFATLSALFLFSSRTNKITQI